MAPQDSNLQTVRGLRQNQRPSKPQVLPAEPAIIEHEPFCARESNACCFDWLTHVNPFFLRLMCCRFEQC